MVCPHCGEEHDEQEGRFCSHCGMSVRGLVKRVEQSEGGGELRTLRCRYCGTASPPPVCLACGTKLSIPDDWEQQ